MKSHWEGVSLIPYDWHPYRKVILNIDTQKKDQVRTQGEVAINKPRKEASEETKPANTVSPLHTDEFCSRSMFVSPICL